MTPNETVAPQNMSGAPELKEREEGTKEMKKEARTERRRFFKFASVLVVIFIGAFAALVFVTMRIDPLTAAQRFWIKQKVFREIRQREAFEKNDIYGGKTPEETYQLFLQALEKQDIELASKYFVRDKQEEIKQRFMRIRDNGKWQLMYADLAGLDSKIEYKRINESWYEIEVLSNKSGGTIAAFRVEKYEKKPLWKLTQFW